MKKLIICFLILSLYSPCFGAIMPFFDPYAAHIPDDINVGSADGQMLYWDNTNTVWSPAAGHSGLYLAIDHDACDVNSTKIGNWDTAYGWDNHSVEGYLKADGTVDLTENWTISGNSITLTAGTLTAATLDATVLNVAGNIIGVNTGIGFLEYDDVLEEYVKVSEIDHDSTHHFVLKNLVHGANLYLRTETGVGGLLQVVLTPTTSSFSPIPSATIDLGNAGAEPKYWKDGYFSGNLSDGTNALSIANANDAYDHSQLTHDLDFVCDTGATTDQTITAGGFATAGTLTAAKLAHDASTYIDKDDSNNMTFTDAVVGTRTLKQLGCPTYKYIKATGESEGDLHLSDGSTWAVSKALIKVIRVVTSSTDWDLYILQNDNGHSAADANILEMQIAEEVSGNANLMLDLPYEDEDASSEVHLYYLDNSGANTADIYILGFELL